MNLIQKQYIVDEQNHKIAVQIDLKTFEKIEATLENYALFQLMQESADMETLEIEEAQTYYQQLEKAP